MKRSFCFAAALLTTSALALGAAAQTAIIPAKGASPQATAGAAKEVTVDGNKGFKPAGEVKELSAEQQAKLAEKAKQDGQPRNDVEKKFLELWTAGKVRESAKLAAASYTGQGAEKNLESARRMMKTVGGGIMMKERQPAEAKRLQAEAMTVGLVMQMLGQGGAVVEPQRLLPLFELAAKQGSFIAAFYQAQLLERGVSGLPDPKAAAQAIANAQQMLSASEALTAADKEDAMFAARLLGADIVGLKAELAAKAQSLAKAAAAPPPPGPAPLLPPGAAVPPAAPSAAK